MRHASSFLTLRRVGTALSLAAIICTPALAVADASAFGALLADDELAQPFAQLGRDTYTLSDAERASERLLRWNGAAVPTGRVLGLAAKGWRRGAGNHRGVVGTPEPMSALDPIAASELIRDMQSLCA